MRKNLLIISDHALTTSGVATQSLHLIEGLLKTRKYNITQIGAAMYHNNYDRRKVSENFEIIPANGFGSKPLIKNILKEKQPHAMIIFSDTRYFKNIFEMSDEIRNVCPIIYWHVWDNRPTPVFNKEIYDKVDHVACISKLTYSMCKELIPEKCSYLPHSLPENIFYPMEKDDIKKCKKKTLGDKRENHFVCLWLNRNIKRKRPADVLKAWQIFLFNLEEKFGHNKATLVMHTDPYDKSGQNLVEICKNLKISKNVCFSDKVSNYQQINALHNISDVCLNISHSEGFGLSTLESMQTGNPIIVSQTGGLINQVIDDNDCSFNGISIKPDIKVLNGNQEIPYIHEDYVNVEKVAKAIMQSFCWTSLQKENLSQKCINYVKREFSYEKMIEDWDNLIENI